MREWLDSLDYVLQSGGPVKVARLLRELVLTGSSSDTPLTLPAPVQATGIGHDHHAAP